MFKKILSLALVFATVLSMATLLSSCKGHEHTYSTTWSYDDDSHWRAANCEHTEEKKSFASHEFSGDECYVCGYVKKADDNNNNNNNNNKPSTPKPVNKTYTVTVVNASGAAVAGAKVKFFNGEQYTLPKTTDANGQASATLTEGTWQVMLVSVPEGYAESAQRYTFVDGVVTITLQAK